jgi:CRP/FNR family transcriptional regulator, cyclic AMP receptor protein
MALAARITDHELFDGLNDAATAEFDDRFSLICFRRGELIYSPFDAADAMYVVADGRVRLYRSASDGRQLTLSMVDAGGIFGRSTVLELSTHDGYAEAMTDSALRVVRLPDLERAVAAHPQIAVNLLRALSDRLRETEDNLESLAFRGVSARLAAKLLHLMDRYGRVTPNGIRIDERFTHVQLAEMIGTSRETLTKVINELRESGVIDIRERQVWVIDPEGLERLKHSG